MEGVDRLSIEMKVNARFPKFGKSTQYNLTSSIKQILHASHYEEWSMSGAPPTIKAGEMSNEDEVLYKRLTKEGAVFLIQFKYDCDVDRSTASDWCVYN